VLKGWDFGDRYGKEFFNAMGISPEQVTNVTIDIPADGFAEVDLTCLLRGDEFDEFDWEKLAQSDVNVTIVHLEMGESDIMRTDRECLKPGQHISLAYQEVPCPKEAQHRVGKSVDIKSNGKLIARGSVIATNTKRAKVVIDARCT
jgi:hypothetical protein